MAAASWRKQQGANALVEMTICDSFWNILINFLEAAWVPHHETSPPTFKRVWVSRIEVILQENICGHFLGHFKERGPRVGLLLRSANDMIS